MHVIGWWEEATTTWGEHVKSTQKGPGLQSNLWPSGCEETFLTAAPRGRPSKSFMWRQLPKSSPQRREEKTMASTCYWQITGEQKVLKGKMSNSKSAMLKKSTRNRTERLRRVPAVIGQWSPLSRTSADKAECYCKKRDAYYACYKPSLGLYTNKLIIQIQV